MEKYGVAFVGALAAIAFAAGAKMVIDWARKPAA